MAQRYDQKKKDEVVAFIQQHNEEKGRGGQSAAAKKYKVNQVTIRSWMEKAGVATPGKEAKKKGRKITAVKTKKSTSSVGGGDISAALLRMAAIQSEIEALQSEYASLKERI